MQLINNLQCSSKVYFAIIYKALIKRLILVIIIIIIALLSLGTKLPGYGSEKITVLIEEKTMQLQQ